MSEHILPQQFQSQSWLKQLTLFDWIFAVALLVGSVYAYKERALRHNPASLMAVCLPVTDILDDIMYKSIALGFAFLGVNMFLSGLHSYGEL